VRTEGDIDTRTRQWFVVAQVDDPYARRDGRPPLKVGQFVTAEIEGRRLQDVYVLPRAALRPGNEVVTVTTGKTIRRQPVEVLLETGDQVVVRGPEPDTDIVVSAATFIADGTQVRLAEDADEDVDSDGTTPDGGRADTVDGGSG
jgi:hypothetical protein